MIPILRVTPSVFKKKKLPAVFQDKTKTHLCTIDHLINTLTQPLSAYGSRAIRKQTNFSATWQSVETCQSIEKKDADNDQKRSVPNAHDPIHCLREMNAAGSVKPYKQSLVKALDIESNVNDLVLDVGCGLGGTNHHEITNRLRGPLGHLTGVDISEQFLQEANQTSRERMYDDKVTYKRANVYSLPFQSQVFDASMSDQTFQHLMRPLDALLEMIRVTKEDGIIVIADPDYRTFQIDVTGAGTNNRFDPHFKLTKNYFENYSAEAGRRWANSERPPSHLQFDMGALTQKVFNYVIQIRASHSYMGSSLPRLFRSAGLEDIQLNVVPIILQGRLAFEQVMAMETSLKLAVRASNGKLLQRDIDLWWERLQWEGDEFMFGTLNFYICRGVRPITKFESEFDPRSRRSRPIYGSHISLPVGVKEGHKKYPVIKPAKNVTCRLACADNDKELIEEAEVLINNEYAASDTGITLASRRLDEGDAMVLARDKELILAVDEFSDELLGAVQIRIKNASNSEGDKKGNNSGLPSHSERDPIAEFTCFAVKSGKKYDVKNVKTLNVEVEMNSLSNANDISETKSARGRGVGAALMRYAEAHCHSHGCSKMHIAVLCPDVSPDKEPPYKQWLQKYYLKHGYEHHSTIGLKFAKDSDGNVVKDEANEMYPSLMQLVKCKAILFEKCL